MNLIQIQDKLKSLPNDPRVMQLLTGYANGQNPQVPPYLALGELNRRKGEMERAQMEKAGQPPGGTVKDQIEQQTGVMALQQGRQQQAMQNMVRQGMAGPAPAPQGVPQPQPQAQAMASGGLASLAPKGYRSGGIIAFQEAGSVNDAVEKKEKEDGAPTQEDVLARMIADRTANNQPIDSKSLMTAVLQKMAARSAQTPQAELSEQQIREGLIEKNPERYGILQKPIGEDALKRLEGIQAAQRAEYSKRRDEIAQSKPGILQLLGQAAMGTRGQKGGSALASILGGYSELSGKQSANQLQQEQELRTKELGLQQVQSEAMNKVDELRRAQAEGDVNKITKAKLDLQKFARDNNIALDKLLGGQLAAAVKLGETERKTAEDKERNERLDKNDKARIAALNRPGEKERLLAQLKRLRDKGDIEGANALLQDLRDIQGSATADRQTKSNRLIIEAQLRTANNVLTNSSSKPDEKEAAKAEIARLNKQLRDMGPKDKEDDPDKPKPIPVPQPLPSGITKQNASKLLKVGTVYETKGGLARWDGTDFVVVE
jgi:hypothetical protein